MFVPLEQTEAGPRAATIQRSRSIMLLAKSNPRAFVDLVPWVANNGLSQAEHGL